VSAYWFDRNTRARIAFQTETTDVQRIRAVAAVEAATIADVALVLAERGLPADLRRDIEYAIDRYALFRSRPGIGDVLDAEAGAYLFEHSIDQPPSLLLGRLDELFRDLQRRLINDRFGGVLDTEAGAYAARVRKVDSCIEAGTHQLDARRYCKRCDECDVG
jgi:hypothetical protein